MSTTEKLAAIQKEGISIIRRSEKSVQVTQDSLLALKSGLDNYVFTDKAEEIHFYKEIKPAFHGLLMFYSRMYQLEIGRPPGGRPEQVEYYAKALARVKDYFDDNKFMYQYLRSGASYLDDRLFFRPNGDTAFALYEYGSFDPALPPANFDYVVARIKADSLLQTYIVQAVKDLDNSDLQNARTKVSALRWTDSKTGLIELAYAFQSAGCLNDGKADVRQIIEGLQWLFNVELGNYPRTFQEILSRKTGYTTLIDKLRHYLLLRIKNLDERQIGK